MGTVSETGVNSLLQRLLPPACVHFMGICGTGMGSLAGLFHEKGFLVTGSDQAFYPPMSDYLQQLGIKIMEGYSPLNLAHKPNLVVVGNVIRRTNPEAVALEEVGVPYTTMPQALIQYFTNDKQRVVVAGTHGKTTVTSMIAWVLAKLNLDPGFMIGGVASNLGGSHHAGNGKHFIIEGDEYDTAYFDKRPKFLHYGPHVAVLTSCEFDHADIYRNLDEIQERFRQFVDLIPLNGLLVYYGDDPRVKEIAISSAKPVESYGKDQSSDLWIREWEESADGIRVTICNASRVIAQGTVATMGEHNLLNTVATIAVCKKLGIEPQKALDALGSYKGVKRRQELLGEHAGVLVIDDFAHHPSAVRVTCEAVRSRYAGHRIVAVFEPRTNTSRTALFQKDYVPSFQAADVVVIREPRNVDELAMSERFRSSQLAEDLRNIGKQAVAFPNTDMMLEFLLKELQNGDRVLVMSNGNFDNLGSRLVTGLKDRET